MSWGDIWCFLQANPDEKYTSVQIAQALDMKPNVARRKLKRMRNAGNIHYELIVAWPQNHFLYQAKGGVKNRKTKTRNILQ